MAGYLENFGAGEERRDRIRRRIALTALALVIAGIAGYFIFRDYNEKKIAQGFLSLLREQKYEDAYRAWGCKDKPCEGYSYKMFLEDWGPKSDHANVDAAKVARTQHCSDGYLMTLEWKPEDRVPLFVHKADGTLSIYPHPTCVFRFKSPVAP